MSVHLFQNRTNIRCLAKLHKSIRNTPSPIGQGYNCNVLSFRQYNRSIHNRSAIQYQHCGQVHAVPLFWCTPSHSAVSLDLLSTHRSFSLSSSFYEQNSSKIEATVKKIKDDQKEALKTLENQDVIEQTTKSATPATVAPSQVVVKKTLTQKIWAEVLHYYHGFKLLFIDINVCRKLLWRVLNGKTLTRREHRLLIRTTSDLFRLLPFSVFIIVPFMELLLPVAIKLFPGMLPSTFQTAKDNEDKIKQSLKVKIEMAKFLQKTLDEMSVQHKDHRSEEAKQFTEFFHKIRTSGDFASKEEIMKFSKLFEDEITLDSLSRAQLLALCRVLEIGTIGTNTLLQFQLRMKLRSLAADDRMIQREGIESLTLGELQQACRMRGMSSYGLTEERLRGQLLEWIDLSLNEKVPPSLLLLSRALMMPDSLATSDKLKATISTLPDAVATQTKAAIGEREGKIDNKTKIEIIKEEERKIKQEMEEEKEKEREIKEALIDRAPIITSEGTVNPDNVVLSTAASTPQSTPQKNEISSKDLEVLEDALESLSKDTLLVEKEEIKDLKEEIADYQEDVQELNEVVTAGAVKSQIKESVAAKMLFKKVNSMIRKMDVVLSDLEKTEQKLKSAIQEKNDDDVVDKKDELVHIDELIDAIRKIQKVSDETRIQQIYKILGKIDDDQDGQIRVEDVLKVVELIGKDNVHLNEKQVDELIELISKEEVLEIEDKIEKALVKEMEQQKRDQAEQLAAEALKVDAVPLSQYLVDNKKTTNASKDTPLEESIENREEKTMSPSSVIPPTIPPTASSIPTKKTTSSDKML